MFEILVKEYCKINVKDYTYIDKKNVRKWDRNKLFVKQPDILQKFDEEYGEFKDCPVYSDHLLKLIEFKAPMSDVYKKCDELRSIECKARNIVAHEIICVNMDWVEKTIGVKPDNIVKKIEDIMHFAKIKMSKTYFESYDRMNKILLE